jgi:hypothetical protein
VTSNIGTTSKDLMMSTQDSSNESVITSYVSAVHACDGSDALTYVKNERVLLTYQK